MTASPMMIDSVRPNPSATAVPMPTIATSVICGSEILTMGTMTSRISSIRILIPNRNSRNANPSSAIVSVNTPGSTIPSTAGPKSSPVTMYAMIVGWPVRAATNPTMAAATMMIPKFVARATSVATIRSPRTDRADRWRASHRPHESSDTFGRLDRGAGRSSRFRRLSVALRPIRFGRSALDPVRSFRR